MTSPQSVGCMKPWADLPLHIKITYQSQAQYERSIKRETAKR